MINNKKKKINIFEVKILEIFYPFGIFKNTNNILNYLNDIRNAGHFPINLKP